MLPTYCKCIFPPSVCLMEASCTSHATTFLLFPQRCLSSYNSLHTHADTCAFKRAPILLLWASWHGGSMMCSTLYNLVKLCAHAPKNGEQLMTNCVCTSIVYENHLMCGRHDAVSDPAKKRGLCFKNGAYLMHMSLHVNVGFGFKEIYNRAKNIAHFWLNAKQKSVFRIDRHHCMSACYHCVGSWSCAQMEVILSTACCTCAQICICLLSQFQTNICSSAPLPCLILGTSCGVGSFLASFQAYSGIKSQWWDITFRPWTPAYFSCITAALRDIWHAGWIASWLQNASLNIDSRRVWDLHSFVFIRFCL